MLHLAYIGCQARLLFVRIPRARIVTCPPTWQHPAVARTRLKRMLDLIGRPQQRDLNHNDVGHTHYYSFARYALPLMNGRRTRVL